MNKHFRLLFAVLFFSTGILSQAVNLRFVCDAPHITGRSVQLNGSLYSFDFYNYLYKTNLHSGEYTRLGNEWLNKEASWFFAVNHQLFIIFRDGSMSDVDTSTGTLHQLLPGMTWQNIRRVVPVGKKFYTISFNTLFYHPILHPKPYHQIGKADFTNITRLLLTDSTVHTLIGQLLYRIDLTSGTLVLVKKDKAFLTYKTGAVIGNRFYYVNEAGQLIAYNMLTDETQVLDANRFVRPLLFFQDKGELYFLDEDYKLYEILLPAPAKRAF